MRGRRYTAWLPARTATCTLAGRTRCASCASPESQLLCKRCLLGPDTVDHTAPAQMCMAPLAQQSCPLAVLAVCPAHCAGTLPTGLKKQSECLADADRAATLSGGCAAYGAQSVPKLHHVNLTWHYAPDS